MKHLLHRILRGNGGGAVEITHQFMPGKSGQEVLEDLLHCQELGRVWKVPIPADANILYLLTRSPVPGRSPG